MTTPLYPEIDPSSSAPPIFDFMGLEPPISSLSALDLDLLSRRQGMRILHDNWLHDVYQRFVDQIVNMNHPDTVENPDFHEYIIEKTDIHLVDNNQVVEFFHQKSPDLVWKITTDKISIKRRTVEIPKTDDSKIPVSKGLSLDTKEFLIGAGFFIGISSLCVLCNLNSNIRHIIEHIHWEQGHTFKNCCLY